MKCVLSITVLFMLLAGLPLFGAEYPVEKGSFWAAGDVRISSVQGDEESRSITRQVHFSPSLAYFPVSNLALGVEIGFEKIRNFNTDLRGTAIGPTLTCFIGNITRGGFPYLSAAFQYLDVKAGEGFAGLKGSGYQYKFGIGYLDLVASHIAVSAGLEYAGQNIKPENSDRRKSGHVIGLKVGVSYFLY